jgi:hypothetical protein
VNLQYDTSSAGHRIDHTVRLLPGTETFAVSSDPQGLVSGTTSNAWDRTGLPVLEEVNFLGIFFTNGALSMQGNGVSFGSAITKSGANETFFGAPAAGSTTVFFDQRLARGEWPPLRLRLPRVIITSWSWE